MGKNAIIFTGPASSGKSTIAKTIAKKFGLRFYDGGDILKLLAKEMGYDPSKKDWWDTREGMEFLAVRKKDSSFDKKVDDKINEVLEKGNCIVTSWTQAWLYKGDAVKIWVSATPNERAKRMAERDGIDIEKAHDIIKERDKRNRDHFLKLYKIKFGEDYKPFDIVMDTSKLKQKEVTDILTKDLRALLKRIPKSI